MTDQFSNGDNKLVAMLIFLFFYYLLFFFYVLFNVKNIDFRLYLLNLLYGYRKLNKAYEASILLKKSCINTNKQEEIEEMDESNSSIISENKKDSQIFVDEPYDESNFYMRNYLSVYLTQNSLDKQIQNNSQLSLLKTK